MNSTRVTQHVNAPRGQVYRALLDPGAIAKWKVPDGMTCFVHHFEPRVGGSFRVSLTYEAPDAAGKTSAHTDTYHGRFVQLVSDEKIVEEVEFETSDPSMQAVMTITTTLTPSNGGTDVTGLHEALPPGVSESDNETGWRMALAKLAALVEAGQ